MNQATGEPFDTSIEGHCGSWPDPPRTWSFSSLSEVESCVRRYSLRRATYPDIWERLGYPEPPSLPQIEGNVVHTGLEKIMNEINSVSNAMPHPERIATALQSLGGYSAVVSAAVETEVSKLQENPRSRDRATSLESELLRKRDDMRLDIQIRLGRIPDLSGAPSVPTKSGHVPQPLALGLGPRPEVRLEAPTLRLNGIVDLIVVEEEACEIRDYKTGQPKEGHEDQLRLYALLWAKDRDRNPRGIPVTRIAAEYKDGEQVFDPPSDQELERLESVVRDRVSSADAAVASRPPEAHPSPECRSKWCPVRHICDEYWDSEFSDPGSEPEFCDLELTGIVESGPRTWFMSSVHFPEPLLVRAKTPAQVNAIGESSGPGVRVLNVWLAESEEGQVTVNLTSNSEVWHLASSPSP